MKYFTLPILALALLSACTPTPQTTYHKLSGQTMGTSYHITFEAPTEVSVTDVQASIDKRLDEINASMSTYQADSTISKFNALNMGQTITIDPDFIKVLGDSRLIYEKSHHAFDPTVYPLVELWGFGANMSVERLQNPPSEQEIIAVRDKIGLDKVILAKDKLSKTADGVGLDFSAIAKGYGVDVVADVLKSKYQIQNYMVEIGGEVTTLGVNDKGVAWTLAIDKPIMGSTATNREIMTTVSLSGQSMATSGNYRNAFDYNGQTYSHTINPHTAYPVAGGVPSVTVIADTTAIADGWATALTAIPQDDAIRLANDNNIMALFIIKNGESFDIIKSNAYTAKYP
ncbi:FAD:protein FMN transferase [Moraxella oblonga]|uniref:FAD:protein FMN transferase n=1 Tax=Moraxella oblonga TaxID=200413 RepID=UPI0008353954|nr:FAD:protein FMN transferase [Moraxella oblonga]